MNTQTLTPSKTKAMIERLLDVDIPLFVHGSPGIGKSYIIKEIAQKRGWKIIDVRLSQLDAIDLRGVPSIISNQTIWMPPVFLPNDEVDGILFLDELNAAPPSVQAAIYQLVLDRALGEYTMPKGWRIVCAGNRIENRGVVFKMPSPLANRMVHLVMDTDFSDFKEWALKEGIHHYIVAFLGFRPDLLSLESPKESESNPAFPTPRSWSMLSKILNAKDEIENIEPLIFGCVGYGAGLEFLGYLKTYKSLPDARSIFEGCEVEIPTTPSALYAICAALISYFELKDTKILFEFSRKLPVEFCVMLIKDCITKEPKIAEYEEFDEWVVKYGEYL